MVPLILMLSNEWIRGTVAETHTQTPYGLQCQNRPKLPGSPHHCCPSESGTTTKYANDRFRAVSRIYNPLMGTPYLIAGRDISSFVTAWANNLKAGGGESPGLLQAAVTEPASSFGAEFLMLNIAPQAANPDASDEELLLFATLVVFRLAGYPGTSPSRWEGEDEHLSLAFRHLQKIGEKEAARMLRCDIILHATEDEPERYKALKRRQSMAPGEQASWDQRIASYDERSLRAARILDPTGDFDADLRAWNDGTDPGGPL